MKRLIFIFVLLLLLCPSIDTSTAHVDASAKTFDPIAKLETALAPQEVPIVAQQAIPTPPTPELTIEEKIAQNINSCTDSQWIRADNAECLDKTPVLAQFNALINYDTSNTYTYGTCTWYVKNKRPNLPSNLGNANQWVYMAQSDGMATGVAPVVGAVGANGVGYYGHVVYVEAVYDNGTVLISEMNFVGYNTISTRVTAVSEFYYIY